MNKMDIIVVKFQPFKLLQDVMVFKKGACVDKIQIEIDRIPNVVKGLSSKYDIKKVQLSGSEEYLKQYKAEILTRFNNDEILVDIV